MGFSWSLFYCQDAGENLTCIASDIDRVDLLSDRGRPLVLIVGRHGLPPRQYVYVDNLGVIGPDGTVVASVLDTVIAEFMRHGLLIHERQITTTEVDVLGVVVDGTRRHSRLSQKRFWTVRGAITHTLSRRKVAGFMLEAVVGHATFCGLVRRPVLSVFHATYAFIAQSYTTPVPLWASVRQELETFRGLMVLLVSNWCLDWSTTAYSTDASLFGWGATSRTIDVELAKRVGRVRERNRYRDPGHVAARAAALGFVDDEHAAAATVPLDVEGPGDFLDSGALGDDRLVADPQFEELPEELLDETQWKVISAKPWARVEDIMVLEARGVAHTVIRLAQFGVVRNMRVIVINDNLGLVLCMDRSRAKSFKVLLQVRRVAACALARNLRIVVRWVPSERNSADAPSRVFQPKTSADAVGSLLDKDLWTQKECNDNATNHVNINMHPMTCLDNTNHDDNENNSVAVLAQALSSNEAHQDSGARHVGRPAALEEGQDAQCGRWPGGDNSSAREDAGAWHGGRSEPEEPVVDSNSGGPRSRPPRDSGPGPRHLKRNAVRQRKAAQSELEQFWKLIRRRGRQTRRVADACPREAIEAPAGEVHCEVAGRDRRRHELPRGADHHREHALPVLQREGRLREVDPPPGLEVGFGDRPGCGPCEVHHSPLLSRPRLFKGVQATSVDHVSRPSVQQGRNPEATAGVAGNERMAQALPFGVEGASCFPRVLCLCELLRADQGDSCGPLHDDVAIVLRPPGLDAAASARVHHQAMPFYAGAVCDNLRPPREGQAGQDRRVRQRDHPRPAVDHGAQPVDHGTRRNAVGQERMALRLSALVGQSEGSVEGLGGADGPLPDQAQRRLPRPTDAVQVPRRHEKAGGLEARQERGSLREAGACGADLAKAPAPLPAARRVLRVPAHGHHGAWADRPVRKPLLRDGRPQWIVVRGVGADSLAVPFRQLGFHCRSFDPSSGFDLSSGVLTLKCLADIKEGAVAAVLAFPDVGHLSIAAHHTQPRDLASARRRARNAVRLCNAAIAVDIPWHLVMPLACGAWNLPAVVALGDRAAPAIRVDSCGHGARWRKPLSILTSCLCLDSAPRLERRCTGRKGFCSFSGCQHWKISGLAPTGVSWSRISSRPTPQLAHNFAFSLLAPLRAEFFGA